MVAISGASGFIGKNLLCMLENSYAVSLRDSIWEEQLSRADIVINLVGKAHDHKGIAKEEDYYYANVELTKQVFKNFVESSAKLLIHISSLAAIEEFESFQPLKETDECKPSSWYGKSKRKAEEWLLEQNLPLSKKLIIVRPPMVHGVGDKGNLGLLYKMISKGLPYPLASFDNKRSFISIDNFSFLIEQIILKQETLNTGIYHVADDEYISTNEIIEIIKSVTGRNVPNLSLPSPLVRWLAKIGDIIPLPLNSIRLKKMTADLLVSNTKIKESLDLPKLPLTAAEGLRKTIQSFLRKTA